MIDVHDIYGGGGVNSKKGCLERKTEIFQDLKILPGIGRLRKTQSNKVEIFWKFEFFGGMPTKNSGRYSRFWGGLLFTNGSAWTALVRAVPPPPDIWWAVYFSFHILLNGRSFTLLNRRTEHVTPTAYSLSVLTLASGPSLENRARSQKLQRLHTFTQLLLTSADITLPSADRERLILVASFSLSP